MRVILTSSGGLKIVGDRTVLLLPEGLDLAHEIAEVLSALSALANVPASEGWKPRGSGPVSRQLDADLNAPPNVHCWG